MVSLALMVKVRTRSNKIMLPEYMVLCSEFLEYLRKPTGTNIEVILWVSLDCTNVMLRSPFVCLK